MARTMAAVVAARRKGIHLKPQDIQESDAPAETPVAPAPADLTLPTDPAAQPVVPAAAGEPADPAESGQGPDDSSRPAARASGEAAALAEP